ncbi:WD40-repeat-containing domain [Phytophthora cactorum]|nr:WD40-repeat-containing domain [Phytophthora cactorum]
MSVSSIALRNSSTFVTEEDRETVNEVDTRTQLCVFAGTVDGLVLYWRFDEDAVVQVNLLVFPGSDGGGHPVVGIVSGTDEWGQSTLISATKDGALARWQLPNGACAEANASLAKELAPLLGLEMLGNRRFAVVVSEESRLMVLDTWRMQLLYCMDTAQEQIRRSIAVGELRMPQHKSPRPRLIRSSSGSGIETGYGTPSEQILTDSSSPGGRVSPSRQSITGGSPDTRRIATFLSSSGAAEQRWDAVVLSLGAEGLVKCFLWTQPRGSTSGTPFGVSEGGGSASVAWGFRWVQRSSWVISWADEAEDITCSQSTSLKDGDNMNPQTALMGSIKNSYFPLSVHVSPDSSSVLLIWKTKFAVLKRKWLCSLEIRSDSQPNFKPFGKPRPNTAVGSCPIAPSEFVRQAATTSSSKWLSSSSGGTTVYWEDGEFSEDGNVILWTNTGHVFQFTTAESSAKPAGKFFIFTKDQDQLVPRSDSKLLRVIDKAMYVTSTDRCTCCDLAVHNDNSPKKSILSLTRRRQHSGYTACMKTGSGSRMEIVHMCHRGMLGLWTMSAGRVSPTRRMPNLSNIVVPRVPLGERVRFHSLTDGFEAAATAAQGENTEDGTRLSSQHHGCLTHFILGRDDTQASSTYEVVRRAGMRRKRQRQLNDGWASSTGSGGSISSTAAAVMASNVSVLATALAPVTVRGAPGVGGESRQTDADESEQRKAELLSYRYLLDIPVIAKGFSDGMLHIGLLSQEHSSNRTGDAGLNAVTRLPCHSGRTTALAHCFWGVGVASMSPSSASNASQSSMDEAYFATEKNPFYKSRFPDPSLEQNSGVRHPSGERTPRSSLTIDTSGDSGSNNGFIRDAPSNAPPSIKFFVFSGGTDGVFRQISVSPLKRGAVGDDGEHWETNYPDRLVATVGIDRKIVIYAPQYSIPPSNRPSDRSVLTAVVGVTPAIDLSCQTILGIEPAHALYSCALQDFISGALTIPVPWTTPIVSTADARGAYEDSVTPAVPAFARNWQHSSALSASIALGVVSLCMSCMEYRHSRSGNGSTSPANKEEFQVLWTFGFDSCEYTQLAARTLLSGVIKRLPPAERSILSAEYSAKLHWEMVRLETETGSSFLGTVGSVGTSGGASSGAQPSGNSSTSGGGSSANTGNDSATMSFSLVVERLGSLVLLMSMIGTYFPGEISPASAREVCDVLVYLLKAPERFVASVSAELLTKGLMLFRPHLVDLSSLIVQLLLIDMREKQRSTQSDDSEQAPTGPGGSLSDFNEGGTGGTRDAQSRPPTWFPREYSAVYDGAHQHALSAHVSTPSGICRHDHGLSGPNETRATPPVSTAEYSLSTQSGSTVPHGGLPKGDAALGTRTMEAVIVIYDLRTATKWRVLDGHASAVSAVRFRSDGQVLVSYAARDGSVRWWNSGNAGLFGGMLKMHQSCLKEHKLAALKESANGGAPSSTGGASAGLKQIISRRVASFPHAQ